ncbi:phage protein Gp36 family protein [Priestia endophytica]|uniref:phage protein Gp36 family protein n=1 Tax=Priestia endophytica TaxID=135735 RepID=UPI003D2BF178
MTYCTPQDVRQLIPIIDEPTMPDIQMQIYIKRAEAYVDGKLRDTYIVPFDPVPELVKDVTAEYSAYLVLRTVYSQNTPNSNEMVTALKENAEQLLADLDTGELSLDSLKYSSIESSSEFTEKIFTLKDITPYRGDY